MKKKEKKKRSLRWVWVLLSVVLLEAAVFFCALWGVNTYIWIDEHMYPRHASILDLRDQELDVQRYTHLVEALPETMILWQVPMGECTVSSDAQEARLDCLTEEILENMQYLPNLSTLTIDRADDLHLLSWLWAAYPDCRVLYTVTIGDTVYDQDTVSVSAPNLNEEQAAWLEFLPELSSVDVTGCRDYDLIRRLQEERPQWHVAYTLTIGEEALNVDAKVLRVENAGFREIVDTLPGLPNLESLTLVAPRMEAQELMQLRQSFPTVEIHWQTEAFGRTLTDETRELDLTGVPMEDLTEAEAFAALCPELEKLILSDCGLDSETLAAFREEKRQAYKVVWTIHFSTKCSARTDDVYFMPYQQGEYYFQESYVHDLMYCEDMVTIDLGHHKIRTVEFARYMPHLQFLILTDTEVQDISPLAECKELIYLELDASVVRDLTPLQQCTALEDLAASRMTSYPPLEPLMQMPWLKNLWLQERKVNLAAMQEALPNTRIVTADKTPAGQGWRNLPNYYKQRDNLGMYYMK